ncbi:MAG: MFS transporter [Isosphaeraceae bacterium]
MPLRQDRAAQDPEFAASAPTADRAAWGICWLMFAATVLTYMDRQTVSLLREPIEKTFAIRSSETFGWVMAAFYLTYAVLQVPAGFLVDRRDLKWTYAAAVAWWSLAAAATAIVPGLGLLIACRALLGVGESFNWPTALRTTARILPPADRGLGNGIFNSGAAVGALITPAVVTYLANRHGWRLPFAVIGLSGFVWVAAWLVLVRGKLRGLMAAPEPTPEPADRPDSGRAPTALAGTAAWSFVGVMVAAVVVGTVGFRHYGPAAAPLAVAVAIVGPLLIAAILPMRTLEGAGWTASLGEIVRSRRFWVLIAVSILINICWHFLVNWIPDYLKSERKLKFETGNYLSTIPFLAADVGNLAGGWLSRRLAAAGRSAFRARLMVMAGASPLILGGLAIGLVGNDHAAVILLAIIALGTTAFMVNYFAFTQEVSARHTGLVAGYLGALGNLGAAGFQPFAGWMHDRTGSHATVFAIIGLAPLLALAILALAWGDRIEKSASGAIEPPC